MHKLCYINNIVILFGSSVLERTEYYTPHKLIFCSPCYSTMSEGSSNTASSASSLDEATAKAIDYSVRNTFRCLSSDITRVIESRLIQFASDFSDSTASSIKHAVQKAKKESYTCKSKGNQQQLDHELQVLDKIEDATHALAQNSCKRAKECLQEGMVLITKRIKAIKLADKSDYGWLTVQEYLSDELASDSEDEKIIYRSERRAERRVKQNKRNKKEPFNGPATATVPEILGPLRISTIQMPLIDLKIEVTSEVLHLFVWDLALS